jgi:shikimate kinase/3-dehydroquinate synthase
VPRRKPILLWGPPAAGKSALSLALSRTLQRPRHDTDDEIARREGAPVREVFLREREWGFRQIESRLVREMIDSDDGRVVSLGGGALLDPALRRSALDRAWVLALDASPKELFSRIAREPESRPLLQGADESRVAALIAQRGSAYLEAHARIDSAGSPETVLARALDALDVLERERVVAVGLGERTYTVRFAALDSLADRAAALSPAPSATLVATDRNVLGAPGVSTAIHALSPRATVVYDGHGDHEKTVQGVSRLWDAALGAALDRRAVLCAIGGGAVSDLTGFAASTLLRGVRFITAPTTVLSMADASVGGKTGVDHALGKNLIGSFHQPSLVLCDTRTLETLPLSERRSGLAEVAKIAAIADEGLFSAIESDAAALARGDIAAIDRWLPDAVRVKARVVAEDEREEGGRAALNFGHTLGHAIESASGYSLAHGHCVALGMRAAARIATARGASPHVSERIEALLDRLELPQSLPAALDRAAVKDALGRDKKRADNSLRFVLCHKIGSFELSAVPLDAAMDALATLERT